MMPPRALAESWFDVAEALIVVGVGVVVRATDWEVNVFEIGRMGLFVDEVVDGVLWDAVREVEDVNVCDVLDDRDAEDDTAEEVLAEDGEIVVEGVVVGVEGVAVGVGVVAVVLLAALALEVWVVEVAAVAASLSTTGDTFTGWMSPSRFACRARSRLSTGRRRNPECIGTCKRIIYPTIYIW